ncbi:MAG: type II toxin-antitoxin system RelE/ParE family toxin [Spirochaetales bacterium]|nr:type II toxin-antitoxin system RelE/ParE family toxin [Spirochaetales bacterium]
MVVVWTRPALEDLKSIFDYIGRDSDRYARRVTEEIVNRCQILERFPEIGRVVPELHDSAIRELSCYSYRILYQIRERIEILAVIHSRRLLDESILAD